MSVIETSLQEMYELGLVHGRMLEERDEKIRQLEKEIELLNLDILKEKIDDQATN